MFYELVAAFTAGVAAAGLVLMLNRLTGGRLPRYVMPMAAAAAMIGVQIWNEYDWFDRTRAGLPEGIEVTSSYSDAQPWRPWTYVLPQVTRFAAVDVGGARTNPEQPGLVMADMLLFGRYAPTHQLPQLIDCRGGRMADLTSAGAMSVDGAIPDARWVRLDAGDPLLGALCPAVDAG